MKENANHIADETAEIERAINGILAQYHCSTQNAKYVLHMLLAHIDAESEVISR